MSNQALNKDNYNGFMQFDRRGELINESIFMFLDRSNTSLNIANAINNNINNQINNDQFTFDVPAETEIQKIWKIYQKTKKPTNTASSLCLPRLLTEKEIEIERDKANKEFIKTSLLMSKDQLDAANEPAGQKNKKMIKDIIDPTTGLFIDDQLKPNEQNFQNTTDNVFSLSHQVQQQANKTVFKKIIKQPIIQPTPPEILPNIDLKTENFFIDDNDFDSFKKSELKIKIGQLKVENDGLIMISDDDETEISKSLIKTEIDIKSKNNLKWKKK